MLKGNLAPEGAVAKVGGLSTTTISGPAKVYDGEEAATQAALKGAIKAGDVVVVRYEGPRRAGHAGNAVPDRDPFGERIGR